MTVLYDPPSGWMYGFPKPYKPLKDKDGIDEDIAETLKRDGYPEFMMTGKNEFNLNHIRFIGDQDELDKLLP